MEVKAIRSGAALPATDEKPTLKSYILAGKISAIQEIETYKNIGQIIIITI